MKRKWVDKSHLIGYNPCWNFLLWFSPQQQEAGHRFHLVVQV